MTDRPNPAAAGPRDDASFDRLTAGLLGAPALVLLAALLIGPAEAMERLAWVLRHLPHAWGR